MTFWLPVLVASEIKLVDGSIAAALYSLYESAVVLAVMMPDASTPFGTSVAALVVAAPVSSASLIRVSALPRRLCHANEISHRRVPVPLASSITDLE